MNSTNLNETDNETSSALRSERISEMDKCLICPRNCGANRNSNELGVCNVPATVKVARAALHMWEEPCISGKNGSGAMFFSGCNLNCVFCQNYDISEKTFGKEISIQRLAEIYLELQDKNANNINLVTPSIYVPQIIQSLQIAKKSGLNIPVIYNCSGYEKVETLKRLEGLIDIYLPDFKYMDNELAFKYSKVRDYCEVAKDAINEMVRQTGPIRFQNINEESIIIKGVIVRHLILPGSTKDSMAVIKYLHDTFLEDIFISIMSQFTPVRKIKKFPELNRQLTKREYEKVLDYAISLGIENAFIQEGEVSKKSFIPKFDISGV